MLYTEEAVRAGLRVRDGRRVFYLPEGSRLTPAARDWLRQEGVTVVPHAETPPAAYRTPDGAAFAEKPEHMTQLEGNILVPKTHPRITFRGKLDTLQAQAILLALEEPELKEPLTEILEFLRRMLRCEVLGEPFSFGTLFGMPEDKLRRISQLPQKYLGTPHFMPGPEDGKTLARLNVFRTQAREAELLAAAAFPSGREDILRGLNRLSSAVYILMLKQKGRGSL